MNIHTYSFIYIHIQTSANHCLEVFLRGAADIFILLFSPGNGHFFASYSTCTGWYLRSCFWFSVGPTVRTYTMNVPTLRTFLVYTCFLFCGSGAEVQILPAAKRKVRFKLLGFFSGIEGSFPAIEGIFRRDSGDFSALFLGFSPAISGISPHDSREKSPQFRGFPPDKMINLPTVMKGQLR
jgi:hypothetical protein